MGGPLNLPSRLSGGRFRSTLRPDVISVGGVVRVKQVNERSHTKWEPQHIPRSSSANFQELSLTELARHIRAKRGSQICADRVKVFC